MKRLVVCAIVILSFLGLMVGTAQAWRGGWGGGWGRGRWGGGGWVGPAVGGAIAGGILASAAARPYYGPPAAYRYPARCPSRSFCEERWEERIPICVRCYPELYRR